jgi:hypothetical protein
MPCEFLIDPKGVIQRAFYGDEFAGGLETTR